MNKWERWNGKDENERDLSGWDKRIGEEKREECEKWEIGDEDKNKEEKRGGWIEIKKIKIEMELGERFGDEGGGDWGWNKRKEEEEKKIMKRW